MQRQRATGLSIGNTESTDSRPTATRGPIVSCSTQLCTEVDPRSGRATPRDRIAGGVAVTTAASEISVVRLVQINASICTRAANRRSHTIAPLGYGEFTCKVLLQAR